MKMVIQISAKPLVRIYKMTGPNVIKSISQIINKFDTLILDQWGVLHDGKNGYLDAINCVKQLKLLNKNLIIISNSSKKKKESIERLKPLGFNKNDFVEVITSGEVIWQELNKPSISWAKKLKKNYYHIGLKGKSKFFIGLKKNLVKNIKDADFLLGTNVDNTISIIDYVPLLKKALEANLPFVCANPDYESIERTNNKRNYCMGSIAKLYKNFGGTVHILGKPSKVIYERAFSSFQNLRKNKIIAIGDSIPHDIRGAKNFGIKSLLITSGIHKEFFQKKELIWNKNIDKYEELSVKPDYICKKFIY